MPLLDLLLAMFWLYLVVLWIWLVISIFVDIFRSPDLGGWGKAGWCLVVIIIPLLGALLYVIVRGKSMGERSIKQAEQQQQSATDAYIRQAAGRGAGGTAAELEKLSELREKGVLTDDEFHAQKTKLLA